MFQRWVCAYSFDADYYNANAHRLVGPQGPWRELDGKIETHERFIEASVRHDVLEDLKAIACPTLILHAGLDTITGPRTTLPLEQAIPGARGVTFEDAAHVLAGKVMRQRFADVLYEFYGAVD